MTTRPARIGRPPKVDADGVPTRDRLLAAGVRAFVEQGFERATLTDIARRADVSPPAVYNHFEDKSEVLVEAARWALEREDAPDARSADPRRIVRRWLAPEFADVRKLLLELHLASFRHPRVAELLARWHTDQATTWTRAGGATTAQVKAFYLVLLGIAQTDALAGLAVEPAALTAEVESMVDALFGRP